jgi:methyl halide transferase
MATPSDSNSSSISPPLSESRARLKATFANATPQTQGSLWDSLWVDGTFLPWDHGRPHPALVELVVSNTALQDTLGSAFSAPTSSSSLHSDSPEIEGQINGEDTRRTRRKALVPGCGRGYDVYFLSARGWDATGLEVSPAAVEAARKLGDSPEEMAQEWYVPVEQGSGERRFVVGDFFKLAGDDTNKDKKGEEENMLGKWDLIWDFTVSFEKKFFSFFSPFYIYFFYLFFLGKNSIIQNMVFFW